MAFTSTVGGVMSGYCEMGSMSSDTTPMRISTMPMTLERMGRSMKNLANMGASQVGVWCRYPAGLAADLPSPLPPWPAPGAAASAVTGSTVLPGRARCMPLTTTRSPASSPFSTTR